MDPQLQRTEMLFGEQAMQKLKDARVAVFGLGGVGGAATEALARSGIGALDLIDNDSVSLTNLNRQIIALHSTLGMKKTDAARARVLDIAPGCSVRTHDLFFLPETADRIDFGAFDYVVDAIDTVAGKLCIIEKCNQSGTPVISSMGTGNKRDPGALRLGDIYETSVCPLARVMRRECRKRGISSLKVLYSVEPPITPLFAPDDAPESRRGVPGSTAFVPPAAGLMIAAEIAREIAAG